MFRQEGMPEYLQDVYRMDLWYDKQSYTLYGSLTNPITPFLSYHDLHVRASLVRDVHVLHRKCLYIMFGHKQQKAR